MNRSNRAVFLDIDGVLSPYNRQNSHILDESCIGLVRELSKHALIVLASSWPTEAAREYLTIDSELNLQLRRKYDGRPRAIKRWLDQHPEVTEWVSIDDDRMVEEMTRMVKRDPEDEVGVLLQSEHRFLLTCWTVFEGEEPEGFGLNELIFNRALNLLRIDR